MRYLLLVILILNLGCSSNEKSKGTKKELTPEDKEFGWIENSAFEKVDEVAFNSNQDLFEQVSSDDSLSKESISRLPTPKIEEVASSNDPVSQGIGKCYGKNFTEADKIFEANYKRYKNNPAYWNQVGTCQFLKGEYRKALLFYNKARTLNANYAPPVNNIGVIHQRQGRDQKALAAFKKAVELNKFSLTPIFNLAQLYLKYGFVDKSQNIFKTLYNKNSDDIDVLNALGTGQLLKENYSVSINYFSKIPRGKLSNPKYGLNFAIALKAGGRVKDAKAVFDRIDTKSMGDLGGYYNKVGRYLNE
ncbi:MAG: hypothetical protein CME70_21845 [Halobacteriovorax sp.]|nr:hypothetical protein [Halobacteriovorax sp.]|tara:strand:- start:38757 stop:39668 length:912 start_codon:yes stop_codon:yes gene_type:complete